MKRIAAVCLALSACFFQRAMYTAAAGHPTHHTAAELQQLIDQQTAGFTPLGDKSPGTLQSPGELAIKGKPHTCYVVVMRLGDGAAWGDGAQAGLKFQFSGATGDGMGGPGVRGPGAVAQLGCAESSGAIAMTMAPVYGADPIGTGDYDLEVFAKHLDEAAWADYQQKQAEQKAEADRMAREEADRKSQDQAKVNNACSVCNGRYQGCVGGGRSESECEDDYRSCAFEKGGPDYAGVCPRPAN